MAFAFVGFAVELERAGALEGRGRECLACAQGAGVDVEFVDFDGVWGAGSGVLGDEAELIADGGLDLSVSWGGVVVVVVAHVDVEQGGLGGVGADSDENDEEESGGDEASPGHAA